MSVLAVNLGTPTSPPIPATTPPLGPTRYLNPMPGPNRAGPPATVSRHAWSCDVPQAAGEVTLDTCRMVPSPADSDRYGANAASGADNTQVAFNNPANAAVKGEQTPSPHSPACAPGG